MSNIISFSEYLAEIAEPKRDKLNLNPAIRKKKMLDKKYPKWEYIRPEDDK